MKSNRIFKRTTIVFGLLMFLFACQPAKITTGVLEVKDAWARPAAREDNGAVYFVIENGTPQTDVLLSARTDVASAVELHLSQMEGDAMSMHHQEAVEIRAGEATVFSPGGLHVMLVGLRHELKTGDVFDVTLLLENAGEKTVTVTVRDDANDD
jgi:copper(I)-binding protein